MQALLARLTDDQVDDATAEAAAIAKAKARVPAAEARAANVTLRGLAGRQRAASAARSSTLELTARGSALGAQVPRGAARPSGAAPAAPTRGASV
eukprot:8695286-Pyramimonas_sp.AAC.1